MNELVEEWVSKAEAELAGAAGVVVSLHGRFKLDGRRV